MVFLPRPAASLNPLTSGPSYRATLLAIVLTMSSLCSKTFLASLLTSSLAANLALPTSWKAQHGSLITLLTEAPATEALFPRSQQPTGYDTCGYRDGKSGELKFEDQSKGLTDADQPLVCPGYNFCNPDNGYSWIACCADYSSIGGYQPYACNYFTTCFDFTQIRTAPTPATITWAASLGGDKFQAVYWSVLAFQQSLHLI